MKDLTEQIYDELNAQVVRMLNHSLNQASRIVELETQLKDHSAQAFSIGETYANALSRIAELEAQLEEAEGLIAQNSHGAAEHISELEAKLAEVPRWISVDERLPEMHTEVMVWPYPTDYQMTAEVDRSGVWSYNEYVIHYGNENVKMAAGRVKYWCAILAAPAPSEVL